MPDYIQKVAENAIRPALTTHDRDECMANARAADDVIGVLMKKVARLERIVDSMVPDRSGDV